MLLLLQRKNGGIKGGLGFVVSQVLMEVIDPYLNERLIWAHFGLLIWVDIVEDSVSSGEKRPGSVARL